VSRGGAELARYVAVGAALSVACAALPHDLRVALAVACALALPLLGWIALRAPREEARLLLPLVSAAVALRLAVATAIDRLAPAHFFSMDQRRYEWLGQALAESWRGAGPYPDLIYAKPGYYVWNALIYSTVGYVPLAAAFSNAAIAGLSIVLVYRLARDLAGPHAARMAALFAAFFPSLVLWSSLNLKDAAAIAAILLALRGAQQTARRRPVVGLAEIGAGLLLLSQLRGYLVIIVLLGIGAGLLLPRLRSVPAVAVGTAALAVVWLAGAVPSPVERIADEGGFELLEQHRRNLGVGGSAYHADADVSSPQAALRFLPVGLFYFLLAPAPWQLWNARQWLTLPEMLVWYALVPQVVFGLRELWRRRAASALPLLCVAALTTVSYALVEANLGTAYRHRAQVLVLYLVLAAVGLAARHRRRARPAEPATVSAAEPATASAVEPATASAVEPAPA